MGWLEFKRLMHALVCGAAASTPYALASAIILLNSSLGRPIWTDEFLHFALSAEESMADAWRVAAGTLNSINHGQTGIYMMLDYFLLSLTGANALALRMPSLVSAAILFASTIYLFRVLGFSLVWRVVAVAALAGQHMLMYFAGEARPYMPLAAATVGILTYYVARANGDKSLLAISIGFASALIGSLIHPYFALYWPAACIVGWTYRCTVQREPPRLATLVDFSNPKLVLAGATLYIFVAWAGWLGGTPHFDLDPFEMMRPIGLTITMTDYSHFQFLAGSYELALYFTAFSLLGFLLQLGGQRSDMSVLIAPATLIAVALALSLVVSWLSYRAHYWILPRQWVGSVALVAIGVVWLWAECIRYWSRSSALLGAAATLIVASVIGLQTLNAVMVKSREITSALAQERTNRLSANCSTIGHIDVDHLTGGAITDKFVADANRNILCGGKVWPEFRRFYRENT